MRPYQEVAWMCVTVNESVLVNHISEYGNQIISHFFWVDTFTFNLGTVIYLTSPDKLHYY